MNASFLFHFFLSIALSGLVFEVFNQFNILVWLASASLLFILLNYFLPFKLEISSKQLLLVCLFVLLVFLQFFLRGGDRALNADSALFIQVSESIANNQSMPLSFKQFGYGEVNHNPLAFFLGGFFLSLINSQKSNFVLSEINLLLLVLFFAVLFAWLQELKANKWIALSLLCLNGIFIGTIGSYARELFLLTFATCFFYFLWKDWQHSAKNALILAVFSVLLSILASNKGFALLPLLAIYLLWKKKAWFLTLLIPVLLHYLAVFLKFKQVSINFFQFFPASINSVLLGFFFFSILPFLLLIFLFCWKFKSLKKEKWLMIFSAYLFFLFAYLLTTHNPTYYSLFLAGLVSVLVAFVLSKLKLDAFLNFKLLFFLTYLIWLTSTVYTGGFLFNFS
jgi:hypothetical protein